MYYHEYGQDIVRTILSDEHKNLYTFVGDTNTYFFQDNVDDKNLTDKMTFMFKLIENAKSWEFEKKPTFETYVDHDGNLTKYKSVIILSITPSDEQLSFFKKVAPDYKKNVDIGIKKAKKSSEIVKDLGGYKGVYMLYESVNMLFERYWRKDYYTFKFYYSNVTKTLTTEEIKKRLSKYLLTKPIEITLIGPQKHRIEDNMLEKVLLPVMAIPMVLAIAIVAVPIVGLNYMVNHDSKH